MVLSSCFDAYLVFILCPACVSMFFFSVVHRTFFIFAVVIAAVYSTNRSRCLPRRKRIVARMDDVYHVFLLRSVKVELRRPCARLLPTIYICQEITLLYCNLLFFLQPKSGGTSSSPFFSESFLYTGPVAQSDFLFLFGLPSPEDADATGAGVFLFLSAPAVSSIDVAQ